MALAVAFNHAIREPDEWFDEPDDLDRVERALASIARMDDPVAAAATLAYSVTRAQGFAEGNKRTALLLARWILDRNGEDGASILPAGDLQFAGFLVQAAAGIDVRHDLMALLVGRR